MNRNKRRRTPVLPMLMLLAALGMGTAGCSQSDYLLPTEQQQGTPTARGDEPLLLSIGAKPGFEGGSTRAFAGVNTRATVDDASGDWTWVAGDDIYLKLTFKDAAGTPLNTVVHRWEYKGSATTGYVANWDPYQWWGGTTAFTTTNWVVNSTKCQVQAFYTDSDVTVNNGTSHDPTISLGYTNGTGDHLLFDGEFSLGEELKVELEHINTRLTFKGLKGSTAYLLKVANADAKVMSLFTATTFALSIETAKTSFTTDNGGNFTFCLPLDDKLDTGTGKVSVEIVESAGGASVGTIVLQGTKTGTAQPPVYSLAGKRFNISVVANGGTVHPGNDPDLLP